MSRSGRTARAVDSARVLAHQAACSSERQLAACAPDACPSVLLATWTSGVGRVGRASVRHVIGLSRAGAKRAEGKGDATPTTTTDRPTSILPACPPQDPPPRPAIRLSHVGRRALRRHAAQEPQVRRCLRCCSGLCWARDASRGAELTPSVPAPPPFASDGRYVALGSFAAHQLGVPGRLVDGVLGVGLGA